MKLSVSAYRAHASAHKKILDTAYQLNYGSTSASHHGKSTAAAAAANVKPFQIDPPSDDCGCGGLNDGTSSDDANTPLQSPRSQNTSRDEDDDEDEEEEDDDEEEESEVIVQTTPASRQDAKIKGTSTHRGAETKSNQRWMKLRTTVQISSAIQKKPPLKREDSFLQRFASRQIPETQETVEDTGSEGVGHLGAGGDGGRGHQHSSMHRKRRARRKQAQPLSVVNPDENFYFHWLLVMTVSVLYNLWTLIVRQSFPEFQTLLAGFWLTCDCLSDVCFVLDVGVQLRTGYLEQGLMVYDARKLAAHYVRSRAFLLDIAALCPLDLLQLRLGAQPLLRFPRFLKAYRAVDYYYMVESRTVYPNLWRVANLIHILLILAHWFGCFYFLLSEAEGFQGDWVYPHRPGDYATLTRKYLGSLYWSTLTLTTIGDLPTPETNAEPGGSVDGPRSLPRRGIKSRLLQFGSSEGYVFTIVSYLIGVFIFATIVGQVGNVITNRNANRLEFERLLDGAKTYMRHHKVPGGMKRRVLRWYDYSWSRGRIQGGGDINTALGLLPDKLKTELALHVNLSVLKKVTIFQECQPEFLRDLVLKMRAYIFTPGDSICRKGEVAREMFIIADGILEVLSEAGRVLTTMKAGDFFGEIGILNLDGLNKRTADVRSVGYSELFSLSREDVLAAMKDYPEAQEILQALGRKRLMEVKASARQHQKEKEALAAAVDGKGLVNKLKSEAKGLRNALRKSRTHRRAHHAGGGDSVELQPLQQPCKDNVKGVLKRMPRVRSNELSSQEEDQAEDDEEEAEKVSKVPGEPTEKVTSPLGAGLPLLARLRLLKEKQENEERTAQVPSTSTSIKSPPPVPQLSSTTKTTSTDEGVSDVPLVQRLLPRKDSAVGNKVSFKDKLQSLQETSEAPHWRKLKNATMVNTSPVETMPSIRPLLQSDKQYRCIDDLSPEYGGLPFVKKLKILNERQKLAELKEQQQENWKATRSCSLDGDDRAIFNPGMTRSRSEGSSSSSESNETLERRHLKSILKKLSEDGQMAPPLPPPAVVRSKPRPQPDLRQLMRAPTIEGYAARHSKLAKSVTFNRDTLPSPPAGEEPCSNVQIIQPKQSNQMRCKALDEEQQYFADILMAIKQVMSSHLQDLRRRYEERVQHLEDEVRMRDATIVRLQAHIADLQKSPDDSFTDSAETVVSGGAHSLEFLDAEEPEEPEEPEEQPHSMRSPSDAHIILNMESEEEDDDEDEEPPPAMDNGSNNHWEIEMLAAQMRQQRRSASLDPAAMRRPEEEEVRRTTMRVTRGGSCETQRPLVTD